MTKQITKQRLYHSNFNHHGHRRGKANRSRAHNLRAKAILENLYTDKFEMKEICDETLTKNNVLYIADVGGKLHQVKPGNGEQHYKQITSRLDREKKEYLDKLESAFTDSNKAELSDKRAKAKAALKRYFENCEAIEEAELWENLIERLGKEEIDTDAEIEKLKNLDTKIKRFNQKVKRIEELKEYNQLIGVKSRNTEYTVFSKELVYKFPDDTKLKVKPMDLANFANHISKTLYPDFDTTYLVIHCDENPENPHAHIEYSGKNKKTGEFDIQQQVFLNLKRIYKKENKPFPFEKNHYNDLTFKEVQKFGEVYQDFIFEKMNEYLNKKEYEVKLEKRTAQEKLDDFEKFKDRTKPSQKREYTRAKKLKKENEELNKQKQEQIKTISKNNEIVEEQETEKNNNIIEIAAQNIQKKELTEEVEYLEEKRNKLLDWFKNGIEAAYNYALSKLPSSLLKYAEIVREIDEEDTRIADQLENKAVNLQRKEEQKEMIKKSRNKSFIDFFKRK